MCFDLACQIDADCPVSTTDDTTCTTDVDCAGATDFCDLRRDTDADGTLDTGACAEAGDCNTLNGLCAVHTLGNPSARIGDPCQADVDCTDGGTCVNQAPFIDSNGVVHQVPRNGYCTILGCMRAAATGHTCPTGSACYTVCFGGACMDNCDPADVTGCRDDLAADGNPTGNGTPCDPGAGITTNCDWYGDYECYDWTGFTWIIDGTPVLQGADETSCEYLFPVQRDCSFLASITGGCSVLAPVSNPSGLDCRYPTTGTNTLSGEDPDGRCLDDPAGGSNSGPICPGTWDSGGNCVP